MNTAFLLMAQYSGKVIIPIEDVCRDYFSHLNVTKLVKPRQFRTRNVLDKAQQTQSKSNENSVNQRS
jgi:hypothetical protein